MALTERIKDALIVASDAIQKVWELLEEAKAKEVWRVLPDCASWKDYVTEKLEMSERHSYRLLDQAEVIRELETATDTRVSPDITVREAQRLKPHLKEVTAEIREAVENGTEPHEAVSLSLNKRISVILLPCLPRSPRWGNTCYNTPVWRCTNGTTREYHPQSGNTAKFT